MTHEGKHMGKRDIDSLAAAYLYALECNLATLEELRMYARTAKSRIARQTSIVADMIEQAERFGVDCDQLARVQLFKQGDL